jgi:periplasmic protein TonB
VTRSIRTAERPLRLSFLLAGAVVISMGIFALVPLLLRQTSYQPHFPQATYALLIPIRPEIPPDLTAPEPELTPPPEPPAPPEPEMEAKPPDIPDIKPPEPEPPEPRAEMPSETLDMPPLEPPALASPAPDPPALQTPVLHALSLSALPTQSSPMNLKVNLRVEKAPSPGAVARAPAPQRPATRTRFGLDEVDQKPVSLAALKPNYPYKAKRMGIEGYVTVQFLVDSDGRTRDLKIVAAKPEGIFDETVRKTVPRWRFKPGKKAGQPVDTWVEMTIRFELGQDG